MLIIAAFVVFITHQQQNRYCTNKSVLEICSNRQKSGKSVFKNRVKPCYTLQLRATFSKPIRQRKRKISMKDYPCTVTSPCGHQMAVTQTEGLLRVSLPRPSQTVKLAAAVKKIDTQ